jgi:anaerobic magnesium-protoporphyrin IX monomethyl ester cyclase
VRPYLGKGALRLFSPQVLGISLLTTEYPRAAGILSWSKRNLPDTKLSAGGYHVSALPERSLRELPLDVLVMSEGELTMRKLCRAGFEQSTLPAIRGIAYIDEKARFVRNLPREFIADLDSLPISDRELLDGGMAWYLTPPGNIRGQYLDRCTTMLTSRGCPGNCIFCSSRAMWTNKVRQRSPENVLDELESLIAKYGLMGLFFLDDTFTARKKWVLDFCRQWQGRGIKLTWGCSARVNTVDDEMLEAMKSTGCVQLDFGVESGNDEVLRRLHKGQNRRIIERAFRSVHRHGLRSLACFIIGNPGETGEQMMETLDVAKRIKPDFAVFSILTPLPGSPLYDIAITEGWITGNESFNIDWSIRHSEHPVMGIEHSPKELLKMRRKMEDAFFLSNYMNYLKGLIRNPVNWHELSRTLGWDMRKTEDGDVNTEAETIMMAGLVFLE